MYSNEKKNGFSIVDIIVKIVFAALFIFILIWLFQKKVPNMTPFYSNVFRENIKYMQEAGESYFTDDKMPTKEGQEVKITLSDMFDKKLILPFVDENGNSCNQYESYVSVTKNLDTYSLKTNLVCNNESDYTVKVLGCHTYCKDKNCSKVCTLEQITQYQYKKLVNGTSTKYSCPSGYKLKNKYCYKTTLEDTRSAEIKTVTTKSYSENAKLIIEGGGKTKLTTIIEKNKEYADKITTVTEDKTITNSVAYACQKTKTERQCSTTNVTSSYTCNCTTNVGPTGKGVTSCSTCYSTVPVESCSNVDVKYNATCYKDVTETIPGTTTYSCPAGYTPEGSGSSLKCYKYVNKYSCPAETTASEGSGLSLKCYKVEKGSFHYECPDSTYDIKGTKCVKTTQEETNVLSCDSGYKLEGKVCNKYGTEKKKATAKKTSTKYYTYKWSEKEALSGWKKTGKTKTVNGKEICE